MRYLLILLWGLTACAQAAADHYRESRAQILGTDFAITLVGIPEARAQALVAEALELIEDLSGVLSTYHPDSEISSLNVAGHAESLSPALHDVLTACAGWRSRTDGAFSCRLGSLISTWREAEAGNAMPDRGELRRRARELTAHQWSPDTPTSDLGPIQFEPSGLAKGYILDRVAGHLRRAEPAITGLQLEIGGDGIYHGLNPQGEPWRIALGEPVLDGTLGTLALTSGAIAFSGHNRRGMTIERRRFSHILNPEDGWALRFAPAAVVVAPDATDADALATALTVMPVRDGLELVESLDGTEALIITEGGTTFSSTGWHALRDTPTDRASTWGIDRTFLVEYQVPRLRVAQYRRPYLAIWITDDERRLIRQLLIHGDELRWLREMPHWWRRHGRRDDTVVDGIARPTPSPGQYSLTWDGRDAQGQPVPDGGYVLHVEIAREHGDQELVSLPFRLAGSSFDVSASGEQELAKVTIRFRPDSDSD